MKNIIVCADDYGMSQEVDQAILDLIVNNRISATSCMTLMPTWFESASELKKQQGKVAFGLHFDLGGLASLPQLMLGSLSRTLVKSQLASTLNLQLDNFEQQLNATPDYIDGHQHVHAFPVVRDVLATVINQRYQDKAPWIRNPSVALTGHDSALKAMVIKLLNVGFQSTISKKTHAKLNTDFAGLYSIDEKANFPDLIEGWMHHLKPSGLIMCHPATRGASVEHSLARANEYDYLASDRYLSFLAANKIKLVSHPSELSIATS